MKAKIYNVAAKHAVVQRKTMQPLSCCGVWHIKIGLVAAKEGKAMTRQELSNFIVQKDASVFDATAALDAGGKNIVFVCEGMKLLATFTDGDLRRYVLRSGDMSKPISSAANYNPYKLHENEYKRESLMDKDFLARGIPIINYMGDIVSIEFLSSTVAQKNMSLNMPVVIMAGGRGSRLTPYTDVLPKPLIPVGDKTITEHIIEKFIGCGCNNFTMIVNYKKELIKAYFKESLYKENIRFIDETSFLGTGGGLKLLEGMYGDTFFMTNCDILIDADYEDILRHHRKYEAIITMICAIKKIEVPYGTVEMGRSGKPVRLVEKPEYPLLTNTGLYVIEPAFLENITEDTFANITDLIQLLIDAGKPVGVYPIGDAKWLDMGQIGELGRMEKALRDS